jgi:hypothetical protein
VFENGTSTIYLGTYTLSNPAVGELRFLFRLQGLEGAYPTGKVTDTRNGTVIESADIWKVGTETRAKVNTIQIFCAFAYYLPSTTLANVLLMTISIAHMVIYTLALSSLSGAMRHRLVDLSNVTFGSILLKITTRTSLTT